MHIMCMWGEEPELSTSATSYSQGVHEGLWDTLCLQVT